MNKDKYKYFFPFYEKIKGKAFTPDKLIFDKIEIGEILILGVNSNFMVGQDSSEGFLPIEDFDKELIEIIDKNSNKHIILAWHHNISGTYQDKITGQWIKENRKDLIPILEKNKIKCIFHGNEHTPKSEFLNNSKIYVSDSGALASKDPKGSFKIYEVKITPNSICLKNNIYELRNINAINEANAGKWITIQAEEVNNVELESFEIYLNNPKQINPPLDIPAISEPNEEEREKTIVEVKPEKIYYSNKIIQDQLYSIVRERKLFHSGHFHWSESSRAHNWIDVSKLIEKKEDLKFVKNAIVDLITSHNLYNDCDLMIGLGTEGNIISSKASIKFNIPYTFLPYSYRYEESHEFAKKLNYDNSNGDFKSVLIIADVVNDGRTIRRLIREIESDFFSKVKKIVIVSLFYTGQQPIDTQILNYKNLPPDHNTEDDYEVNNIEYYAVFSLRIEKCPYGKNFREECLIYRDELSCVHLFYDEDKYKNT